MICKIMLIKYVYFFFQAEDGIRDLTVTGVQTCALPICLHHLALLDLAGGDGVLDRHHDDVPQPRVAALGPAEHPDHERAPRARVVCDLENRLLLHHGSPLLVPATSRARRSRPPATAWSSTAAASRRSAPCRPPWRPARRAPRPAWCARSACRRTRARSGARATP